MTDLLHIEVLDSSLPEAKDLETRSIQKEFVAMFDKDYDGKMNRSEWMIYCRLQVVVVYMHNQERVEREHAELEQGAGGWDCEGGGGDGGAGCPSLTRSRAP